MPIKSVKMKISKNKKMRFFLMSQGSLDPKIRFIGQKVCSVARVQTDTQTHRHTDRQTDRHESEYRGHPFRVSGIFPSTYYQGSVQYFITLPFKALLHPLFSRSDCQILAMVLLSIGMDPYLASHFKPDTVWNKCA